MTDQEPSSQGETHENQDETEAQASARRDADNARFLKYIVGFIVAMFLVGWGSIPLYRIVCKSLDPGGSSWQNGTTSSYEGVEVDESRTIEVRFTANVQNNLPWTFGPEKPSVEVHPGQKKLVKFTSTNLNQNRAIKGKAVYDINPPEAGQYFKKIECFCFVQQTLEPGQSREMPLYFWFEPDVPESIDRITLAYTFFNAESSRSRQHTKR
jgi:cytochrome c oxidase assembly protein subunit 11